MGLVEERWSGELYRGIGIVCFVFSAMVILGLIGEMTGSGGKAVMTPPLVLVGGVGAIITFILATGIVVLQHGLMLVKKYGESMEEVKQCTKEKK